MRSERSVVIITLGLGVEQRLLEGIEVEVQVTMVFGQIQFIDGPAGAHGRPERVPLKVRE